MLYIYIFCLSFFSLILCGSPTFEILEVNHFLTQCDKCVGLFKFSIKGKGKNIDEPIRITLPLKSPSSTKAKCIVSSIEMLCLIDSIIYDLSNPNQILEVNEEEPIYDYIKILNWANFFTPEKRIINHATNCKPDEKILDTDEGDKLYIFGALDNKNIDISGCLNSKNNFSFQMSFIEHKRNFSEIYLEEDLKFEIIFEKPKNEKITCLIPKNANYGLYTVKCFMDYAGEIEIGVEANGIGYIGEKKSKLF